MQRVAERQGEGGIREERSEGWGQGREGLGEEGKGVGLRTGRGWVKRHVT